MRPVHLAFREANLQWKNLSMKQAMHYEVFAAIVVAAASIQACAGADRAIAPARADRPNTPITRTPSSLVASGDTTLTGQPGVYVANWPAVKVRDQTGAVMPNVVVTFIATSGGGSVARTQVSTDNAGVAPCAWRLGALPGENTLVASLAGVRSVTFTAMARTVRIVAIYNLESIGGANLPLTYSGGGQSWTIVGGHYALLDDGTYLFGYVFGTSNASGRDSSMSGEGRYVAQDTSLLTFYLAEGSYPGSSFYAQRGGLFATGTIRQDRMTMKYEDVVDFDAEVYVRAPVAR